MALVKVRRNHQITLPRNLRNMLKIEEGDYVEMIHHSGNIVIHPVKVIPSDQAYFYTKEWQEKEKQADKDISDGNIIGPFDNAKDAIDALNNTDQ
jgi:AbrB family looped-hinge helix DNA binding protein